MWCGTDYITSLSGERDTDIINLNLKKKNNNNKKKKKKKKIKKKK